MKRLSYVILAILWWGCGEKENSELDKMSFIIGKWQSTQTKNTYEEWKNEGGHFSGKGYSIEGSDTAVWELLTIEQNGTGLCYIADVQHNAEPVVFNMIANKENEVVFSNPEHDFPKKITYTYSPPNSIKVSLVGENDKREIAKELFFKRDE